MINPYKVRQELTFALQLLHAHPDFVKSLQAKARERVCEKYRLESNLSAIEAVYDALLNPQLALAG